MKVNQFKKYLRIIAALFLCISMILPVLSCAETGGEESSSALTSPDIAQTIPPETEPEETEITYDFLDVNYQGEELVIFNSEQKYYMIMNVLADDVTGEAVNDAKYNAMSKVEEKYNIDLVEYYCGWDNQLSEIQNVCATGEQLYDVAYLRSTHVGSMFTSSYLYNLYDIQNINIDQPWWNQQMKDDATLLGDHLYYLSSDAHLMAFEGTWGIYFNKTLAADMQIPSPYEDVYNNTWTLPRLTELAKQCATLRGDTSWEFDANGSSLYGMASFKNLINALMVGCNEHYCLKDADGKPYFAMANSATVYDVTETIAALTGSTADGTYISANSTGKHYTKDIFSQNRSVFMGGELKAGAAELQDMTNPYGLLPIPKYNSDQEGYLSNMLWSTLLMTLPASCSDTERAAAVMDALSFYSWRDVLPVYYERLCYRGMRDAESVAMLEIISETRYLNWPIAYGWISSIEPNINTELDAGRATGIASLVKMASKTVPRLIDKTITDLEKID
jgi:hypothetical protein